MADLAREEADRFFNQRTISSSHPEDRGNSDSESSTDEKDISEPAFQPDTLHDDTDDEDLYHNMSTLTTSKTTYQVPTQVSYANTGPKGVIADAQSFARARQSATRRPLTSISKNRSYNSGTITDATYKEKDVLPTGSGSGSDQGDSDEDEIMNQWRAKRLAELAQQSQTQPQMVETRNRPQRRISPSRRTFGFVSIVDAEGYLDAIEHSHPQTTVAVMLYDPSSAESQDVEDGLDVLAEKWTQVRFIKMHHEIAEMEYLKAPAVLGYRGAEVFSTISGARREGLEDVLKKQGFFQD